MQPSHQSFHLYLKLFWITIICGQSIFLTGQTSALNMFDLTLDRYSYAEFDIARKEVDTKKVMFCEDWCYGHIVTVTDTLQLKFNIDQSTFNYFLLKKDIVYSIKSDHIKSFTFEGKKYINYKNPNTKEFMLLEVMVDGKYKLYKHHELVYRKTEINPALQIKNSEGSFQKKYNYYALCGDRLIQIPSKAKKALKTIAKECGISLSYKGKLSLSELFKRLNENS